MWQNRRLYILFAVLLAGASTGCDVEPSPEIVYRAATAVLDREQAQLDRLRPAYDAARQTAMLNVCRELAGATPEESLAGALGQLDSLTKQAQENQANANTKPGDLDATIDQLIAGEAAVSEHAQGLLGSAGKVSVVIQKIKTPGTPEAKRFEEELNALPEVQAYKRQEERLERAKKAADEAEAKLPGGAGGAAKNPPESAPTTPTTDAPGDVAK
jgi:hypothetical protein